MKILSYVLAQRLKQLLHKLINKEKIEYFKIRFIGFDLLQIEDIMQNAESNEIDGAIVFVDLTKASDSSELELMLSVLEHFGFNQSYNVIS